MGRADHPAKNGAGDKPALASLADRLGRDAERPHGAAKVPSKGSPFDHGHYDMRIARDGTWYYRGSVIARKPLVKLFASVLHRDAGGQYWLKTPVEQGRIDVDDVPFIAVEVTRDAAEGQATQSQLMFRTNLDDQVRADAAHPIRIVTDPETGAPAPYIMVRDGLEALMTRAVFYELVEMAVPGQGETAGQMGVWSGDEFFSLGAIEDL